MQNANTMTLEQRIAEASSRGTRAGNAASSWVFDGNTTTETYRRTLEGIEDGDPAVMDAFDWSPLSGEWSGESIVELLGDLCDLEDDSSEEELSEDEEEVAVMNERESLLEELCEAYELAATSAYWDGIAATCRFHLEG